MSGRLVQGEDGVWREPPGHALLWGYFGCGRASWSVLPRSLMHEMPDRWQARMAVLLRQFDETYTNLPDSGTPMVTLRNGAKFVKLPNWLDYRHPDRELIASFQTVEDSDHDR